jgi:hypothetical protein
LIPKFSQDEEKGARINPLAEETKPSGLGIFSPEGFVFAARGFIPAARASLLL